MNETLDKIVRPHCAALDKILGVPMKVLDKGFIRVVDYMGDEAAILQAARVSYGKGTKRVSEDRNLLRRLFRKRHTSPFEMCELKVHVKLPIFVARQWIRHRMASVNEYSARYSILNTEFYMPDLWLGQSEDNKQGSSGPLPEAAQRISWNAAQDAYDEATSVYHALLSGGDEGLPPVTREQSRIVLPLATYTEWYWKVDLHNLLNFLRLRMSKDAQPEIVAYANALFDIVWQWTPNVAQAFVDYALNAHTFSGPEMEALRELLEDRHDDLPVAIDRMGRREMAEFREALGATADGRKPPGEDAAKAYEVALGEAMRKASGPLEGWNKRFLDALTDKGLMLYPYDTPIRMPYHVKAPNPVPAGGHQWTDMWIGERKKGAT